MNPLTWFRRRRERRAYIRQVLERVKAEREAAEKARPSKPRGPKAQTLPVAA